MAIEIFTDSAANIPGEKVKTLDINIIPCSYELGGKIVSPRILTGGSFMICCAAKPKCARA